MKSPADLLFEIGTEELPATNLADIYRASENILEEKVKKVFEGQRIPFKNCRVWATPRRLIFWIEGVAGSQSPKENQLRLLLKQEATGADGKPTEKFLTILKHRNVSLAETVTGDLNGKEYIFIKKAEPVSKTAALLPEILLSLTRSLPFPKNMKWDDSGLIFPRPIRHALCFFGDKPVLFKLGNVRVKNETVIFSKGRRTRYPVKDIPAYFGVLKKHGIVPDPTLRRTMIQEALARLAAASQSKVYEDAFLLNEVNFLVENPQALSAPFAPEFLKLPVEVLAVSMARKQRLFGVVDKNGQLLPRFLAVLDGVAKDKERKIISGNMENILRAKLQDSLFFYREDVKIPLEKKREELRNLIFLKEAGSMFEKSERLLRLAKDAAAELTLPEEQRAALLRAAFLCKSDLLTHMVGEFPELQGIMGKYYALENGENRVAAEAIGEQYLPRTAADRLPETPAGGVLSILDKCDLITASFAAGNEPTSSMDPFGLRRSATAALKIMVEKKIPLSLARLLLANKEALGKFVPQAAESKLLRQLESFFADRFKALLVDRGYREDVVEAAMAADFQAPYETFLRVEALSRLFSEGSFTKACKVVERTMNILRGNSGPLPDHVDPALFAEALETSVFEHYQNASSSIRRETEARNFKAATSLYADAFFDILNEFFEKVFVNAEDPKVRANRLALLRSVNRLYTAHIADLSRIRMNG